MYRRYVRNLTMLETAVCSPMEETGWTSGVASPLMSIAFYAARSRRSFPFSPRQNFEIIVNLKTAKALGLAVPPSIKLRADEQLTLA